MTPDRPAAQVPSLARRLGALLYDLVLLFGVLMLAVLVLIAPYETLAGRPYPNQEPLYRLLLQLWLLATIVGFFAFFWTHGGQTLGMRAWRFRLVREDGAPLRLADALRRLAWATVSLAPAGLGLWWCLFDRERLAWHDRLSRTRPQMLPRR